jgi:serine/threonine-protein kinase
VLKAMAKDPGERYQSAEAMREDLLRARAGQAVTADAVVVEDDSPPAATSVPMLVDPRRRRTARGLVLAAFLLVLVGIGAWTAVLVRSAVAVTSDGLVPTPAVLGLDQRTAVRRLAAEGLRVGSITPRFDEAPVGQVLAQTPEQDIVVPPSGTVDLVVSRGVETTVVPVEVVGRRARRRKRCSPSASSTVAPESSCRTASTSGGGPRRRPGARPPGAGRVDVTLTVASGPRAAPRRRGSHAGRAVDELRAAGFDVRWSSCTPTERLARPVAVP